MDKPAALFLAVAVSIVPAAAKEGKGKGHGQGRDGVEAALFVFTPEHRRIIVDYCRHSPSGLPPGLAKRHGDLPPGLERQLRRKGRLPPGLEKRLIPFPVELERRLPPPPPGAQRMFSGGRAVLLDPGRGLILDVFVAF
jgi:hypothetical protein